MPTAQVAPDLEMHYVVDDFTDPWREAETILFLHGNAESGEAWRGWVPHLAREFRVVRPDMRGYGASTPMPRDYAWTIDVIIDDYLALMRALGIAKFHLVGAKLGGTVARRFAARCPELVQTLTVVGTPPPQGDAVAAYAAESIAEFEQHGLEPWARRTMARRLGSGFPAAGIEWWVKLMGGTPASSQIGFIQTIPTTDITADLPRIVCPTLVITTTGSALGSVEETRNWQQMIPRSTLLVIPTDSYHVAASDPDRCAQALRDFILRNRQIPGNRVRVAGSSATGVK